MKRKYWELMNGTAAEPFMFCFADGDGDGDGDGSGSGDGAGNGDGAAGNSGDGKGGDAPKDGGKGDAAGSKLAGKGLFSKRAAGGDSGSNNGDAGNGDTNGDDGVKPKIPDKFLNKDGTPNVDGMAKAYADLEKAHGDLKRSKTPGGGEVPETADGYFAEGVKLPDSVENLTVTADDPGLKSWAKICKEEGIGKDLATRLMTKMFVEMDEFAPAPIDPDKEMESLGKGGPAMVDGLFVWVDGMERAGDLSVDDVNVIEQIMMTANGARFLAKMRNLSGEKSIPVSPGSGARGMSEAQLDEAYKQAVKDKNYAEQERLDALRDQVAPEGTAPGISGRAGGYSI